MKKLRIAVIALVIATGAFGTFAFTNDAKQTKTSAQETLHWFEPTGSNPAFIRSNTLPNEESVSGCEQLYTGCERGYTSSQLNNSSNPSLGVQPSQVGSPAQEIGQP